MAEVIAANAAPENQEEVQPVEYTEIQLKAIDQGWIPKEEFDGDESEFIDAPEFVRRGELFGKIEAQSRELKSVRQALEAFKLHHTKVKESEYNRALKALQDTRKQAFLDGENEKAFAIEEQIDAIKEEKQQVVKEATQPVVSDEAYTAEFQTWVNRNSWYETNEVMRAAADGLGVKLARGGMDPQHVLRAVETEIKKEFAHKFKGPNVNRAMAVEPSSRTGTRSDNFVMSDTEKSVMKKIVSSGVMTEAEYIKELKATR